MISPADDRRRAGLAVTEPGAAAPTMIEVEVSHEDAGRRLDHVLVANLPYLTRSQIQRLIKDARARVGAVVARAKTPVREGDRITLEIPPPIPATPQPEALDVDIVYDDADLLVVNKPAGMVVHPAAGHASGTLVNALLHHVHDLSGIGGTLRPGIVHRLDRGTSGLMVIAKHDRAHAALAGQFRNREVDKRYVTLVWGTVRAGRTIDLPIGRDPVQRKQISTRSRRARTAVTSIVDAEPLAGVSLLTVVIATGRTHQIRVHLSEIGHPIVGDPVYAGPRRRVPRHLELVQSLRRPFLHAASLAFRHPSDDRPMSFNSDLPEELADLVSQLRAISAARSPGA